MESDLEGFLSLTLKAPSGHLVVCHSSSQRISGTPVRWWRCPPGVQSQSLGAIFLPVASAPEPHCVSGSSMCQTHFLMQSSKGPQNRSMAAYQARVRQG